MKQNVRRLFALLLLMACCLTSLGAQAGAYPERPITLIVPYGAGGTTDLTARQLAIQLGRHLGVPLTVINQGGASGAIGTRSALSAPADGYTLLVSADSLGTQRVMGISDMSYGDFRVIAPLTYDPKVIVVAGDSEYTTMEALLKDMQARPGQVKMSYTGPGGSGHVQSLILNRFGFKPALTAYPGGSDCILAVLGHQVDFTNSNYSTIVSYLASGDLRLLAVSAQERLPAHPELPALSEIIEGSSELMAIPYTPLSLLVHKDVPEAVYTALRTAALKAFQEADWVQYCDSNALDRLYERYQSPEEIAAFYAGWESLVSWLLYDAGAAPNSPELYDIPRPASPDGTAT